MIVSYKGYELCARRERCMAGYTLLYFSIFRESDGFECLSSYTTGSDTAREYITYLKERVDAELQEKDPWDEGRRE